MNQKIQRAQAQKRQSKELPKQPQSGSANKSTEEKRVQEQSRHGAEQKAQIRRKRGETHGNGARPRGERSQDVEAQEGE